MRRGARLLLRSAFLAHRYLGIALGLMMLTWCLSGFVMMYVSYPALSEPMRLSALPPIDWGRCCTFPAGDFLSGDVADFQLDMLGKNPLLKLFSAAPARSTTLIDLSDGRVLGLISPDQARTAAVAFGRSLKYSGDPIAQGSVLHDQWTVEAGFRRDAPLFKFTWIDSRKPVLYISSRTGAAVQLTTVRQRFWNWLGAIPHWIYFISLRERTGLWTEIVVWTSLLGSCLTGIGLYLGALQFWRMRGRGRASPYRGFRFWHHLPGLLFGVFTLTWVLSGLFSMNPWGFLQEDRPRNLASARATSMTGAQVVEALTHLRMRVPTLPIVSVRASHPGGIPRLLLIANDAERLRVDLNGLPAPLTYAELAVTSTALMAEKLKVAPELLTAGDAYYFRHHDPELQLPVYRAVSSDAQRTRYYFDPVSGELLAEFGPNARGYRWLHEALHRGDFVQSRPLWDALMLGLLGGVTFVCGTGAYLGIRRLFLSPVA
jgi:PepSY-associated TM region